MESWIINNFWNVLLFGDIIVVRAIRLQIQFQDTYTVRSQLVQINFLSEN